MARFLVGQMQGMRVLGRTGVAKAEVAAMVETAQRILG
jgi:TetR/AcrR family transcriptional regulator, transcriptional repressor for nem operon